LDALPDNEKPTTGTTGVEKTKDFFANQEIDVVIKAVINYQLEDDSFQQTIQAEMEAKKDGEKVLDESEFKKENGKYTKEAMATYLFKKKTGATLTMKEKTSGPEDKPKSHLGQY